MIHFLWIGTAIGLLGLLVGRFVLRSAPPQVRYLLSLGTLLVLVLTAGTVYQQQYHRALARTNVRVLGGSLVSPVIANPPRPGEPDVARSTAPTSSEPARTGAVRARASRWHIFLEVLASRAPWVWILGTPLMLVVLAMGCRGSHRLRRGCAILAEGWLVELSQELQHSLDITRQVALAVSHNVLTPILVGAIRPIILLPPVMLTGCSPEQLKMILLHELAHVRRRDALVNLGQRLIEALLFFHPMIWVISRWVRAEREECCDAIVVEQTGNAREYAEALAQLASATPGTVPSPALAAARHPLVRRIRRILQLDDSWVALPGAIAAGVVAVLFILALPTLASLALSDLKPSAPPENEQTRQGIGKAAPAGTAPLVGMWIPDGQAGGDSGARFGIAARSPHQQRVLRFPEDRSMGQIAVREVGTRDSLPYYLGSPAAANWVWLGAARGPMVIPAGREVRLLVSSESALRDLSPLADLRPDDLDSLSISCWGSPQLNADEAILPAVSKLTGLKSLALEQVNLSEKGIALLQNLRSLKFLSIRSAQAQPGKAALAQLDDRCVEQLAQFTGLVSLCLGGGKVTDEALAHLVKLSGLRELDLWGPEIRDPGLIHLERLVSLQYLRLGGLTFNQESLAAVGRLTSLRVLDLGGLKITDAGMVHLAPLTQLEDLRLNGTEISDQGLAHLRSMGSLKRLELAKGGHGTGVISDAGAAYLAELKSLEHLSLFNLDFTDAGLAHLATFPHLKTLYLPTATYADPKMDQFVYTDAGLEALSRLSELEELMVGSPAITDAGLAHLARLPRLTKLDVTARQISNEGLSYLAGLASLESLSIRGGQVTVSGLNRLSALTRLRKLFISGIAQDNQGLDLSSLRQLEELTISMRRVQDGSSVRTEPYRNEDMAWLAGLPQLKSLQGFRGISDAGMQQIATVTNLERLNIGGPGVTDAGLADLSGMQKLNHLSISGHFTDAALQHLEGLKSLRLLSIEPPGQLSTEGLQRLQKALPELHLLDSRAVAGFGGG